MDGKPTDFWGKVSQDDEGRVLEWHPLVDHCIDVAACFATLLASSRLLRRRMARAFGWDDLGSVHVGRLAVLCLLHDLGKLNSGFQGKVLPPGEGPPCGPAGHVNEACVFLHRPEMGRLFVAMRTIRAARAWFADSMDLPRYLLASWSHHGDPVPFALGKTAQDREPSAAVWKAWSYADPERGLGMFDEAALTAFPDAFDDAPPFPRSPAAAALFCGAVSLADWIGSNRDIFPYSRPEDGDRWPLAQERARQAMTIMGIDAEAARSAVETRGIGFERVFGFDALNRLQATMAGIDVPTEGSIVLIESETGSGKTEAAMIHALRLFKSGAVDAVYFALPTRTSGVQMHGRVVRAVGAAFGDAAPPVVLAVPGYVRVDDADGRILPDFRILWNDEDVGLRGWAAENAKRYLAVPFAVGTIDQILLSVLRVRHGHMRAACLARTLIVIDEVHASDHYMTALSAELVRRHAGAGGHVLLMSATLGAAAAKLYLGGGVPSLPDASALGYPLVRMLGKSGEPVVVTVAGPENDRRGADKQVSVETVDALDNPGEVARVARTHAERGARVLVIRNTVKGCIDVLDELKRICPPSMLFNIDGTVVPHHGRFAAEDRRLLDEKVQEAFGKGTTVRGMILVATQTVEQSLDIDADILVTDICPIDVLLQRIGRLHRHLRDDRPLGYERATAIVLAPASGLSGAIEKPSAGIGPNRAYEDVRIVELTLRAVRDKGEFVIPAMNRELVEACLHPEALAALDGEDDAWRRHGIDVAARITGDRAVARLGVRPEDFLFGDRPSADLDPKATTRLGESDVSAVFDAPFLSPLGKRIGILRIPAWMFGGKLPDKDARPTGVRALGGQVCFFLANTSFSYDKNGLSKSG